MTVPDDTTRPVPPPPPTTPPVATAPAVADTPAVPGGYGMTPPAAARPRGSVFGVIALVVAIGITFLYFVVKVFAAAFNGQPDAFDPSTPAGAVASLMGVLGILTIVPVALVIVFGHIGMRARRDGSNAGRLTAAIALGAGYVHLIAWFTRLIVAAVLIGQTGDSSVFLSNIFWWA